MFKEFLILRLHGALQDKYITKYWKGFPPSAICSYSTIDFTSRAINHSTPCSHNKNYISLRFCIAQGSSMVRNVFLSFFISLSLFIYVSYLCFFRHKPSTPMVIRYFCSVGSFCVYLLFKLINSLELSPFWEADTFSAIEQYSQNLIETESSLQCSQKSSNGLYPEAD
jgi:hypothetical protein